MDKVKSLRKQLKFKLGFDPVIEKRANREGFIPDPYESVCLISADFELAWAWQWANVSNSLEKAKAFAGLERENIPHILNLCDTFNIPITWATVGHLFLESCKRANDTIHADIPRLPHLTNNFWKFNGHDWFQNDPGADVITAPHWYASDLVDQILAAKTKHEIGCHTFSHIDCRNEVCTDDVFISEIKKCQMLAEEKKIDLKSFVHPAHTIGNLDNLAKLGFTNFRTDYRNVLGYPRRHANGMWELEQTMEFRYYDDWTIDYQIKRYITIIKRAIKSNTVCVFWFHPSFEPIMIEKVWPELFRYLDENRNKIWVTTHSEYIDWLNANEKN